MDSNLTSRRIGLLCLLLVSFLTFGFFLLILPYLVSSYILSIVTIILYFAYVGQAWNLAMGFSGQLSLGHALYIGLGAYTAAALYVHFGIPPLIGLFLSMAISAAAAALIVFLAAHHNVHDVYFALLTIAFAEFTRLFFSHFEWVSGTSGLFLPLSSSDSFDLINLRGSTTMFYYIILTLVIIALSIIYFLMTRRAGYYLLAVREDPLVAQSLGISAFRYKMLSMTLSAAMTSVGGVFLAFYYNTLFPENLFGIHRSVEIILAPIIGGIGTFIGPVIGALALGFLGELMTVIAEFISPNTAGIKEIAYAIILFTVIKFLPGGLWPWISRKTNIFTSKCSK
ncbi:MAG: branched-chain amino acid ABC transporter permease [Alphaproteobacteria bacterium]|nr:branched-chain amino acid ABC transporter permease [Alphaproteobacteria bacterium]